MGIIHEKVGSPSDLVKEKFANRKRCGET